jgi:cyclopropane-fatty-acyl-phospholipid synthase
MSVETIRKPTSPPLAIDSARWPTVERVPSSPVAAASAAIVDRLLRRVATRLPLRLAYPDGSVIGAPKNSGPTMPTLLVHRPDALARRIGRHGLIGFGESYMAGEWSSTDLAAVLTVLAESVTQLVPRSLQWLRPIAPAFRPRWRSADRDQARTNVSRHYDLSNELFAEFLDETMTYSSALFTGLPDRTPAWPDLAAAQRRKIDRLLDMAGVQPGSRVLEIGTGWGELCIRAAGRGAHVRSVTLSIEQQRLGRRRVAAAGLSDLVQIDLCDYRDVSAACDPQAPHDPYDAVISVEMIEAVGYHSWPGYFAALEQLVRPGGRVAIQAITMPHARMLATRNTHTWIQKYIFPGGLLPSTRAIAGITERRTGLRTVDMASLRPHYAETLRLWRERFTQRRDELAQLGFDEVFGRMWELYLAYSEAGFRSGYLDVYQWTFEREGAR